MPNLFLIAGPNGAGKTTTHGRILSDGRRVDAFVNADEIAADLRHAGIESTDIRAGRMMLDRVAELAQQHRDIAFETTLASRTLKRRIDRMQQTGYLVHLIYLWLPSADMAVARVAARVKAGGHSVPEPVIRRRFERSMDNFFNTYRPVADSWLMLDNSLETGPRPIAWRNVGGPVQIVSDGPWERLRRTYEKDPF